MAINHKERNKIFNYLIEFVKKNPNLRVELMSNDQDRIRFNLRSTGATINTGHEEPSLKDLQQLSSPSDTGLPFNKIHFRTSDSGPGLADMRFVSGQFTVQFIETKDSRVTDLCEHLNEIIGNPQSLKATREREEGYLNALNRLNDLKQKLCPTSEQEIILEIDKIIKQAKKLKEEGQTPVVEITQSLNNTHHVLRGKMSGEEYIDYAKKVQKNPSNGLRILGGIMMAIGILIIAVGVALSSTGIGLAPGIITGILGGAIAGGGLSLFSIKKPESQSTSDEHYVNSPMPK